MSTLALRTKQNELKQLNIGDTVLCTNGHEYEFVRVKLKKFIGKRNGGSYDIPIEMFVKVVSKAEKVQFDCSQLSEGDLFYIVDSKQQAILFRYKYMINAGRVMAENPVTGIGVRVDVSLIKGEPRELSK